MCRLLEVSATASIEILCGSWDDSLAQAVEHRAPINKDEVYSLAVVATVNVDGKLTLNYTDAGSNHAESAVVSVPVAVGDAPFELDDSFGILGVNVARMLGAEVFEKLVASAAPDTNTRATSEALRMGNGSRLSSARRWPTAFST